MQQEEMSTLGFSSRKMRSYSLVTIAAPTAVSSAPENPSFTSARSKASIPTPGKDATKDGATLAYTDPAESITRTFSMSLEMSLAFCGHTEKHIPQRMHSFSTTWACPAEKRIAFTGQ